MVSLKSAWATRVYLKINKQKSPKKGGKVILSHPAIVTLAIFSGKTYNRYKTNYKEKIMAKVIINGPEF